MKRAPILDRKHVLQHKDEILALYGDKIDVDFIDYVLEFYFLRRLQVGLLNKKKKEITYRQMKRHLQRAYPDAWRDIWKDLRRDMNKMILPRKKLEKLIKKEGAEIDFKDIDRILRPKKSGRARAGNFLDTVLILRGYFTWRLGSPHWNVIVCILEPYCNFLTYNELQTLWQQMKKRYLIGMKINEVEYARMVYEQYARFQRMPSQ
jgi:hypothetical protein